MRPCAGKICGDSGLEPIDNSPHAHTMLESRARVNASQRWLQVMRQVTIAHVDKRFGPEQCGQNQNCCGHVGHAHRQDNTSAYGFESQDASPRRWRRTIGQVAIIANVAACACCLSPLSDESGLPHAHIGNRPIQIKKTHVAGGSKSQDKARP